MAATADNGQPERRAESPEAGVLSFPAFRSEEWIKSDFENLVAPSIVLEGQDLMPSYLAEFPTANLYPGKIAQVREQMKTSLFRQALFKVQNVEVTYMESCREPRILRKITAGPSASGPNTLVAGAADWWNNPKDVKLLREELWSVDRCGEKVDYNVRYYNEGGDGFSTAVYPTSLRDFWNSFKYYYS